jgi:hypothetical protein
VTEATRFAAFRDEQLNPICLAEGQRAKLLLVCLALGESIPTATAKPFL